MKGVQRASGLILPAEKPEKPTRTLGPLELRLQENREEASDLLCRLKRCISREGLLGGSGVNRVRWEMFYLLAESLLGPDAEWEEPC